MPLFFLRWLQLSLVLFLAACGLGNRPQEKELVLYVGEGGRVQVQLGSSVQICQAAQTCTYRLPPNATAQLQALADPGFFFAGWSGDCVGFGGCQVAMSQDRRVEARFEVVQGDFSLALLAGPLVIVPAGTSVELGVALERREGFNPPPEALEVHLASRLVGDAVDQIAYRYIPQRSTPERLVLELIGPKPREVWTYLAAPAQLRVRVGGLERSLDFTLATAPCLAGCGR